MTTLGEATKLRAVRRRATISTPYPSVEAVAAELGVSKTRVRELRELMDSIAEERVVRSAAGRILCVKRKSRGKTSAAKVLGSARAKRKKTLHR